jgi:hypothetical protein
LESPAPTTRSERWIWIAELAAIAAIFAIRIWLDR